MAVKQLNEPKGLTKAQAHQSALLPDNYLYISHLDQSMVGGSSTDYDPKFWRLPCCPETIQDSMGSTYGTSTALGRSAPILTYQSSGPRKVQIEIQLHRDMMDDVNIGVSTAELGYGEDYVDSLIRALQSIALPKYNQSDKAVEPPLVALRLSNEVFIKGVVEGDIGIEYKLPIQRGGRYAQVRLSFNITEVDPYDAGTVFKNGSFRGMVKTLSEGMGLTI